MLTRRSIHKVLKLDAQLGRTPYPVPRDHMPAEYYSRVARWGNRIEEGTTRREPLCDKVGDARVEYDLSLDYASFLHSHPDLESISETREGIGFCYHLKNGGSVEIKHEKTGIGNIVVYFKGCPSKIYRGLKRLEGEVISAISGRYNVG